MTRRLSLGALAFVLVVGPVSARGLPPIPTEPVSVDVIGAPSARQGERFEFEVTIENHLPVAVSGFLQISLDPPDDEALPLPGWIGILAAGARVTVERNVITSQWFASLGTYESVASGSFRLQSLPSAGVIASSRDTLGFDVLEPVVAPARFEDVTEQVGITTTIAVGDYCQQYAAGAAWGDADGDGELDLYIAQREGPSELWLNRGDHFVEDAAARGVRNGEPGAYRAGIGAVFIDYDGDGPTDLFVINDGPNRLYRNNGDGTFTDVAPSAGVADDANHTSAAWGDFDDDGHLDLFVTSHGRRPTCESDFAPGPDHLYRADGDGTFTDVTDVLDGAGTTTGLGFQAAWVDVDRDGDLDLYLGNDKIFPVHQSNVLWRNDGPGPGGSWLFTDVSSASGAGVGINTMGIGIGDYDRDGRFDIAASNIGPNVLLANRGAATFEERAAGDGIARADQGLGVIPVTWGLLFADLNNDAWEDLFVVAGQLDMDHDQEQPDAVYMNAGGTFLDLSAPSGAHDPAAGRGIAAADYDRDGRVDLVVANVGSPPRLLRNATPSPGHWLELRLTGGGANRPACGAEVTVEIPGQGTLERIVTCGSVGLASGSDPTVHVGLGPLEAVPRLTVTWPSGAGTVLTDVPADRVLTLTEPG